MWIGTTNFARQIQMGRLCVVWIEMSVRRVLALQGDRLPQPLAYVKGHYKRQMVALSIKK
jgi:hypothetical protein